MERNAQTTIRIAPFLLSLALHTALLVAWISIPQSATPPISLPVEIQLVSDNAAAQPGGGASTARPPQSNPSPSPPAAAHAPVAPPPVLPAAPPPPKKAASPPANRPSLSAAPRARPIEAPPTAPLAVPSDTAVANKPAVDGNGPATETPTAGGAGAGQPGSPGVGDGFAPRPAEPDVKAYLSAIRNRVQDALIYPPSARRYGISGHVGVQFSILANGTVAADTLRVAGSRADSLLEDAALDTIRLLGAFPPPPVGTMTVHFEVEFSLQRRQ